MAEEQDEAAQDVARLPAERVVDVDQKPALLLGAWLLLLALAHVVPQRRVNALRVQLRQIDQIHLNAGEFGFLDGDEAGLLLLLLAFEHEVGEGLEVVVGQDVELVVLVEVELVDVRDGLLPGHPGHDLRLLAVQVGRQAVDHRVCVAADDVHLDLALLLLVAIIVDGGVWLVIVVVGLILRLLVFGLVPRLPGAAPPRSVVLVLQVLGAVEVDLLALHGGVGVEGSDQPHDLLLHNARPALGGVGGPMRREID